MWSRRWRVDADGGRKGDLESKNSRRNPPGEKTQKRIGRENGSQAPEKCKVSHMLCNNFNFPLKLNMFTKN